MKLKTSRIEEQPEQQQQQKWWTCKDKLCEHGRNIVKTLRKFTKDAKSKEYDNSRL